MYLLILTLLFDLFGALVQDTKERAWKSEEKNRLLQKNLEEEKQGLSTRCTDLLNDLQKQAAQWKEEKSDIDSKVKVGEGALG